MDSPTATEVKRSASTSSHPNAYPSPPPSASPRFTQSPNSPGYRQDAFPDTAGGRPRRGSSLSGKHPGDMSHRPLDTLAKEKALADKSRHSTRKHRIRPDSIDNLDDSSLNSYHHGGPYDATLFARNNTHQSPLQATADTNAEALKATPKERVIDSIQGHRPLDGVANYAPGQMDRNGHTYNYEQGENMMTDLNPGGGAYKRWPGVQYHPDDIKGKGEPSYSIEKALKEHSLDEKPDHRKSLGETGIEMKSTGRNRSGSQLSNGGYDGGEGVHRRGSLQGLKKRIGSLRKPHKDE